MPSDACPYPEEPCVACVNGLAGFMSERATGTAFGSTSCVGSVGTWAASTGSSAGEEASNAPGITSVCTCQPRAGGDGEASSRGEASARMNVPWVGGSTSVPSTVSPARGVRWKRAAKAERERCA